MKIKLLMFLALACLLAGVFVAESFPASAGEKEKLRHISENLSVDGAGFELERAPSRAISRYPVSGAEYQLSCGDINPDIGTIIRHDQIGDTWYDYQKNGSVGRMISLTDNGHRYFSWTYCNQPFPPSRLDLRYVDANCMDPSGSYLGQTHADGGETHAGYTNTTHLHDGTLLISHHRRDTGTSLWYSMLTADEAFCGGYFSRHWDIPDYITGASSGRRGHWPKAEVSYDPDEGRDYIHVVMTEGIKGLELRVLAYERCYLGLDDTLICECYEGGATKTYKIPVNQTGEGASAPISHWDTSCHVTPVVVVSPVSKRVALAYLRPTCDGSCDYLSDIAFVESINNGDDWIDGSKWPPTPYNISDFGCTGTERGIFDLNACYDYEDSLHIVYVTCRFDPAQPGLYDPHTARLYHWSRKDGASMIAGATGQGANPGVCNFNIAKMSISAKDPTYLPGGDSVYLFTIWTQFDEGDNTAGGYTNGDIYGCGSFDGGNTWCGVYNLTNTRTPDCGPGECVSEHWSSLAQNMYNGDLHIQYICDRDAGGAVLGEGQWMSNPVMYLHLSGWSLTPQPRGMHWIEQPGHWYHPPIKVNPGDTRTIIMKLFSIGSARLICDVTSDHPCIQVSAHFELDPKDSATVFIILDGTGACSDTFIAGHVILTTNEQGGKIDSLNVHAVVADDYYECPIDSDTYLTLENAVLRLHTNANSEEWIHDIGTFPDTVHQIFWRGGTIVATTSDNDTAVGRYMYEDRRAGARDKLYTEQCDVEWEPDFWIVYTKNVYICPNHLEPPAHSEWFWWEASNQIKFFKEDAPDVYKRLVIKYVTVKRHDPPGWWPDQTPFAGYDDTYIGVAYDVDCPWEGLGYNSAGYDPVNHIAWQRGFESSGAHPEYLDYYCGIALADAGMPRETLVPYGSYNVRNDQYLYPQIPWGWKDGELYQLASSSGNTIQDSDAIVDRSWVFTAQKIDAGADPDYEARFTVVLAVAPGGLSQLQEYVDSARAIVARERTEGGLPALCGDCNGSFVVDVGDIVYLVSYLFKGSAPPKCPVNRGDCNSDGVINVADIVYLVGYLYRGGPAPVCPGIW